MQLNTSPWFQTSFKTSYIATTTTLHEHNTFNSFCPAAFAITRCNFLQHKKQENHKICTLAENYKRTNTIVSQHIPHKTAVTNVSHVNRCQLHFQYKTACFWELFTTSWSKEEATLFHFYFDFLHVKFWPAYDYWIFHKLALICYDLPTTILS